MVEQPLLALQVDPSLTTVEVVVAVVLAAHAGRRVEQVGRAQVAQRGR